MQHFVKTELHWCAHIW